MKNLIVYTDRMTIIAIVLLTIGLTFRYIIGKRRFSRRGIAGLQHFNNYKQALLTNTLERLVNIIATFLIIAGIILILIK